MVGRKPNRIKKHQLSVYLEPDTVNLLRAIAGSTVKEDGSLMLVSDVIEMILKDWSQYNKEYIKAIKSLTR